MKIIQGRNSFRKARGTLFVFLSLLILFSCKKEEPIDTPDMCAEKFVGEFKLLENARSSIPYLENTRLFFKDVNGHQAIYEFLYANRGYDILSISTTQPCESDSSRAQIVKASSDSYLYLINEVTDIINMKFMVRLNVEPFFQDTIAASDQLGVSISYDSIGPDYTGTLTLLINPREIPQQAITHFSKPLEEVVLIDRTFFNVYTNADFSFFYNYEQGIIAFKDKEKHLWVLEKTEIIGKSQGMLRPLFRQ